MIRPDQHKGFTLVEVTIAIAVLGIALSYLVVAQSGSVRRGARTRDIFIATLLARSKIVDLEEMLFRDGFQESIQTEEGNFEEEGHQDFKWQATIAPADLSLDSLRSLCDSSEEQSEDDAGGCEQMFGSLGGFNLDSVIGSINQRIRLVQLVVSWPEARRGSKEIRQEFTVKHIVEVAKK